MKFKSQVYTEVSGSVGGITYGHNRGGLYARSRAIPTDPNTTLQQVVRSALAQLAARWTNTITSAQRDAWELYAYNVTVPDVFGDPISLSGQQHYLRSNIPRLANGFTVIDDGPTTFSLAEYTPVTVSSISAGSDDFDVNFTDTDEWVDVNNAHLIVYSSPPFNGTRNWYRGPYNFADSIDGDSVTPPTTPATISSPFALAVGQGIGFKVRLSLDDGRLSTPQYIGPQQVGI